MLKYFTSKSKTHQGNVYVKEFNSWNESSSIKTCFGGDIYSSSSDSGYNHIANFSCKRKRQRFHTFE